MDLISSLRYAAQKKKEEEEAAARAAAEADDAVEKPAEDETPAPAEKPTTQG